MRAYLSRTSAPTPVLIRAANGFQIILGKVRPNTSPGREPSTSSDHCSTSGAPAITRGRLGGMRPRHRRVHMGDVVQGSQTASSLGRRVGNRLSTPEVWI